MKDPRVDLDGHVLSGANRERPAPVSGERHVDLRPVLVQEVISTEARAEPAWRPRRFAEAFGESCGRLRGVRVASYFFFRLALFLRGV